MRQIKKIREEKSKVTFRGKEEGDIQRKRGR